MKKKSENSTVVNNPFNTENKEKVWKELDAYSKPITRDEFFKRQQAHKAEKERPSDDKAA